MSPLRFATESSNSCKKCSPEIEIFRNFIQILKLLSFRSQELLLVGFNALWMNESDSKEPASRLELLMHCSGMPFLFLGHFDVIRCGLEFLYILITRSRQLMNCIPLFLAQTETH